MEGLWTLGLQTPANWAAKLFAKHGLGMRETAPTKAPMFVIRDICHCIRCLVGITLSKSLAIIKCLDRTYKVEGSGAIIVRFHVATLAVSRDTATNLAIEVSEAEGWIG